MHFWEVATTDEDGQMSQAMVLLCVSNVARPGSDGGAESVRRARGAGAVNS